MDRTTLESLADHMQDAELEIRKSKGPDYTRSTGDVLQNFRDVAQLLDIPVRIAWAVYFMKHVEAVLAWASGQKLKSESLIGRFHDLRNYCLLGAAIAATVEEKSANDES